MLSERVFGRSHFGSRREGSGFAYYCCGALMIPFSCTHCGDIDHACSFLLLDHAGQSLCMKAKGWRRSKAASRNWCCLNCRVTHFPEDMTLPIRDNLHSHCAAHLPTLQPTTFADTYNNSYVFGSQTNVHPQPPPPSPPMPEQLHSTGGRGGRGGQTRDTVHRTQGDARRAAVIFPSQCRDQYCHASHSVCATCDQAARDLDILHISEDVVPRCIIAQKMAELACMLNTTPMQALPRWVLNPTKEVTRRAQHVATHAWDDCGNLGGSALMLILLRPLLFGMPWVAPLRIFGVPPPAPLLDLDGAPPGNLTHDNHRTNCLEGLLGHFREVGAVESGHLLQDCWELMSNAIRQQGWGLYPAWRIARMSLNLDQGRALLVGVTVD